MTKEFRVLLVHANTVMENLIPVGVSLLAGALKKDGIEFRIFDTTFYKTLDTFPDERRVRNLQIRDFNYSDFGIEIKSKNAMFDEFIDLVNNFKPSLIALSIVEPTYFLGLSLLRAVKDRNITTIVGGIPAMLSPGDILREDCVDIVCVGEGESVLPEVCKRIKDGLSLDGLAGIWLKDSSGGIIKNTPGPLADLNTETFLDFTGFLPQRFVKPIFGKKYRMIPFELSRGCPYGCTYCSSTFLAKEFQGSGKWYREKSLQRIRAELELYLKKYSADFIYFVSDAFLAINNKELEAILSYLEELEIPFWANTRLETLTEAKMEKLERTQCVRLSVGIEHGDEIFRKRILKRSYSNELCTEKFRILAKSRIPVSINNMIGFPGESRDLVFDTIKLTKQCLHKPSDTTSLFIFAPFRGTSLRETCVREGYIPGDYWVNWDTNVERDFQIPELPNQQIAGLMRTFSSYCKFPESDWPLIEKAEKFGSIGNSVFNKISKIYWSAKRGESIAHLFKE